MNYRHGEVFLQKIEQLPADEGEVTEHKSFIVGHSETGHHHVLKSKKTFTVKEIEESFNYLVLDSPADIVHEKDVNTHDTITVEPGIYKVIKKQEYNPFTGLMESVWD